MSGEPGAAERINRLCFELSRELAEMDAVAPPATPLARTLLRVVGRVVIDTASPGARPDVWASTEEMALQWIDEALRPLGYEVHPTTEGAAPPEVG